MNDRLISADKAKEVLKHLLYETAMNNIDIADIYEDIIENRLDTWIELIPTVDAVEVVRCKDCVYYNASEGFCEYLSNNYAPAVDMEENDFCSKGKRREDETD